MQNELIKIFSLEHDFEKCFIEISKLKLKLDSQQMQILYEAIKNLAYTKESISWLYLLDSLMLEYVNIKEIEHNNKKERHFNQYLCQNFDTFFPNYIFIKKEHTLSNKKE